MPDRKNDYIYADIRLLRSKIGKRLAVTIAAALLILVAALLVPGIQKYGLAEKFVNELYTTTMEDLIDPTARVERLRMLATDDLVDELLQNDGIPAVVLHQANREVTTAFQQGPRAVNDAPQPDLWTDELPGKITINDAQNNKLLAGWRGVLGVRVEKVSGEWLVTQISDVDWQKLYPIT